MLTKNQKISLYIDGMSAEGSGIGHFEGMAVFVPGSAPGDLLTVHIIKSKKNYAIGKIVKINKPSADRIDSDCPAFPRCGGCCYRHISYEAELRIKQQKVYDAFLRIGHINITPEPIIGSSFVASYRNKAQFPVGAGERTEPLIGFYAVNSHRIIPCTDCKLQPPEFETAVEIIKTWIEKNGVTTYESTAYETTAYKTTAYKTTAYKENPTAQAHGLLRHIYLRRGHYSHELMVCLVINGDSIPAPDELISALSKSLEGFKTLVLNINREETNVILGDECKTLFGDGYITDTLCGLKFRISPLSFYQVNTLQTEALYKRAAELAALADDDVLLDLFCGTGTIGLTMASQVAKLVGVEIVPQAVADARLNAIENHIENAEFICADAAVAAEKLARDGITPTVILVDPPRKGLARELIDTITDLAPKRIVYISCDPATLARDCAVFNDLGYTVSRVTPVDMFPRTKHVETVCVLSRN